jgi:GNAT superfamily N-acetyltransferase
MEPAARYLRYLPDEPRWVDTRGMLLCWPVTVIEGEGGPDPSAGGGFAVVPELEAVGAVVGRPGDDAVVRAAGLLAARRREAPAELLAQPEDAEAVAHILPGWGRDGATLHTLGGVGEPPALRPDAEIALLEPSERRRLPPAGVPAPVYREIEPTWRRGRPVAVAFVDGRPAAFCLGILETESLWDVSIETLEPYRRGGLAAACFEALRRHYRSLGKEPVWGAHHSNPASLRLACRLGFLPAARLEIFVQPEW